MKRLLRLKGPAQTPNHLIQPGLRALLHLRKISQQHGVAGASRRYCFAEKRFFRSVYHRADTDELAPGIGGLRHICAKEELSGYGHMLMTCEQDIEIQLLTNMISHIFGALGKRAACRKIALEPAVINADG